MKNLLIIATAVASFTTFTATTLISSDALACHKTYKKCGTKVVKVRKPKKKACKKMTISRADFAACGGKWYASTTEGYRSPMFTTRTGTICTKISNDYSYDGHAAPFRTYVVSIRVR